MVALSPWEHEVLHGRFGELLVDFSFEIFELLLYLLVGGYFPGRRNRERVRVFSRNIINAPRLQIEHYLRIRGAYPGLAL